MLKDIVDVVPLGGYCLHVRFEDGIEGDVDVAEIVSFVGVLAELKQPSEFAKVRVDAETGTIAWPNGADLDPVVLYARITGTPVTTLVPPLAPSAR